MMVDYEYKATRVLDLEIVNLLTTLHEYKLSQDLLNKRISESGSSWLVQGVVNGKNQEEM